MKVIYPNSVTAATADERAATFPASNMTNLHPKKIWKATSKDATFKLTVSDRANALALFNIYTDTLTVTVKNDAETETLWGPETYNLKGIDTIFELITDEGDQWVSLWVDYDYQAVAHKIICECTLATGVVYAGVAQAGYAYSFADPQLGLTESLKDYSVVKELNNGAIYTRKRDVVDVYSGTLWVERDAEFYRFMKTVAKNTGPQPLAWRVSSNLDHHMYTVFAKFETMPQSNFGTISHKFVNFSLTEVV